MSTSGGRARCLSKGSRKATHHTLSVVVGKQRIAWETENRLYPFLNSGDKPSKGAVLLWVHEIARRRGGGGLTLKQRSAYV